ncbi:MAG TPA: hypothetical protein VHZ55_19265 [Bryobacteraceae bacterium]|nr:hypothetical protein [Bryobacteraceae bacterium]
MNASELRQSLGLIALANFTRNKDVGVDRSREALRSGTGSVMGTDQDGRKFQVLRLSEASDFLGDYEAMDANGQWRVCTELQVVE